MSDGTTLMNSALEILSLLAVAFLLGYLLRLFMVNKWKGLYAEMENENMSLTNDLATANTKVKSLEDNKNYLKAELDRIKKAALANQNPSGNVATASSSDPSTTGLDQSPGTSSGSSTKMGVSSAGTMSSITAPPVAKDVGKSASNANGIAARSTTVPKTGTGTRSKSTAKATPRSKTKAPARKRAAKGKKDDLTKVEGIGPKIQKIFNKAGITSFDDLGESTPTKLRKILLEEGPRYKMHDPKTWPRQAKYAATGKWKKLQDFQDSLKGGKA